MRGETLGHDTARHRALLFVAHPDDDAIFAGALQRRLGDLRWHVVYLTNTAASRRGAEARAWQEHLGTSPEHLHFLGYGDDEKDWRRGRSSIDAGGAERGLRDLGLRPDLVVTHNRKGEYGHPHHAAVHQVSVRVFANAPTLTFAMGLESCDLAIPSPGKRRTLRRFFPSQRQSIDRIARATETFAWHDPAHADTPAGVRVAGLASADQ